MKKKLIISVIIGILSLSLISCGVVPAVESVANSSEAEELQKKIDELKKENEQLKESLADNEETDDAPDKDEQIDSTDDIAAEEPEEDDEDIIVDDGTKSGKSADELLDEFVRGEIDAEGPFEGKETFNISDLTNDDEEWLRYEVKKRLDFDNDGENELYLDGPYGGMILDARDGKVVILDQGGGTAAILSFAQFDNAFWICHSDTSHAGREYYFFDKYNGKGEITESTELTADYWDSPNDKYDENSDFKFKGQKISMKEFEGLRWELFYMGDENY